jgi:hypothetical protein
MESEEAFERIRSGNGKWVYWALVPVGNDKWSAEVQISAHSSEKSPLLL